MLKEDFGHQNMVPFFGSNIKQNLSEHSNQTVLENHTGSIKNFKNKQEIPYMFDPQQRVNQVNGTPVYDEELVKRFIPSSKKQQELPIKQVRVGPGLNQGYSDKPCGGLNQANKRDFIMPKNVDELRVVSNPKKTYQGRILPGLKSGQRGVQAKVNKNLPPIANNTAKKINPIKNNNLIPFDIFFDEILLIYFNSKYKMTNINTV